MSRDGKTKSLVITQIFSLAGAILIFGRVGDLMTLAVRFNARSGNIKPFPSRQRRLNWLLNLANREVQPSLTRRDDEPRRHHALKRAAKFKPSLRDEEGGQFAQKCGE
jgi:hypothetical protein